MRAQITFAGLYVKERDFLLLCGEAGAYGSVVPNSASEEAARNLEGMKLLHREGHAYGITSKGIVIFHQATAIMECE